jgi:hypothetical protein
MNKNYKQFGLALQHHCWVFQEDMTGIKTTILMILKECDLDEYKEEGEKK